MKKPGYRLRIGLPLFLFLLFQLLFICFSSTQTQAYTIDWLGVGSVLTDPGTGPNCLGCTYGDAPGIVNHTANGGLTSSPTVIFLESMHDAVVLGQAPPDKLNTFGRNYSDELNREFVIRKTDPAEFILAPVRLALQTSAQLETQPKPANFGGESASQLSVFAQVDPVGQPFLTNVGGGFAFGCGVQPPPESSYVQCNTPLSESRFFNGLLATNTSYKLLLAYDFHSTLSGSDAPLEFRTIARSIATVQLLPTVFGAPEPSSFVLVGSGFAGLAGWRWKRRQV